MKAENRERKKRYLLIHNNDEEPKPPAIWWQYAEGIRNDDDIFYCCVAWEDRIIAFNSLYQLLQWYRSDRCVGLMTSDGANSCYAGFRKVYWRCNPLIYGTKRDRPEEIRTKYLSSLKTKQIDNISNKIISDKIRKYLSNSSVKYFVIGKVEQVCEI